MSHSGEHRPEPVSEADKRHGYAFFLAAAIATTLFVGGIVLFRHWSLLAKGPDLEDIVDMLQIFLSQLAVAAIFVIPAMLMILLPAYNLLRRLKRDSASNILILFFLSGVITAYIPLLIGGAIIVDLRGEEWNWMNFAATLIIALPAGICALIGGIIFCRMTVWRKPESGDTNA